LAGEIPSLLQGSRESEGRAARAFAAANNPAGDGSPLKTPAPCGAAVNPSGDLAGSLADDLAGDLVSDLAEAGRRFRSDPCLILKIRNIDKNNVRNIEVYVKYSFGLVKNRSSSKKKVPAGDKPIIPATRMTEKARLKTAFLDIVIGNPMELYIIFRFD
jgi:hypothetical protein